VHCVLQIHQMMQNSYFAGPLLNSGRTGPPRPITPPRPRIILKSASKIYQILFQTKIKFCICFHWN